MRTAQINRKTTETDIALTLNVDGTGASSIQTGCGFLDHMLTLFAKHGRFDLTVTCVGDTYVDYHHTVEDVAICLGKAFFAALGNKAGICRYGDTILPMDEALILSAVDFSGRSYFGCDFERCANELPLRHFTALCKLYGVSADELLDTDPKENKT
ncbi:MAG: imidazoleglycerol-phosphate dehydratase [Clostridia bacterium]|nr:imidazoleglycerol-phosphate dehydratase [Clostridia bacterium]